MNILPTIKARGRGALGAPKSRFDIQERDWFDDGWDKEEVTQVLRTFVTEEPAKSVITYNTSPIFHLIGRSMPIAVANTGVSIVMRGPVTIIWTNLQVLILKTNFLQKPVSLIYCVVNWRVLNIRLR